MSDLKHTPGPWSCMSESEHEGVYLDDCVHSVSKAAGRADIICLSPSHEDYELSAAMWDANARLIAAAPELLEALVIARDYAAYAQAEPGDLALIDAAIAKATGERA